MKSIFFFIQRGMDTETKHKLLLQMLAGQMSAGRDMGTSSSSSKAPTQEELDELSRTNTGSRALAMTGKAASKKAFKNSPSARVGMLRDALQIAKSIDAPNWGSTPEVRKHNFEVLQTYIERCTSILGAKNLEEVQTHLVGVDQSHRFSSTRTEKRAFKVLKYVTADAAWRLFTQAPETKK